MWKWNIKKRKYKTKKKNRLGKNFHCFTHEKKTVGEKKKSSTMESEKILWNNFFLFFSVSFTHQNKTSPELFCFFSDKKNNFPVFSSLEVENIVHERFFFISKHFLQNTSVMRKLSSVKIMFLCVFPSNKCNFLFKKKVSFPWKIMWKNVGKTSFSRKNHLKKRHRKNPV